MTPAKFQQIMSGGIGDSTKRAIDSKGIVIDTNPEFNRPIIGWLGIGMLGIAQICHEFRIISYHQETQTAFQATIRLMDFLREKVGEIDPDDTPDLEVDVGQFTLEEVEYESEKAGTYVIASDMRSAFVRKFREKSGNDRLPQKFSAFLEVIRQKRSAKEISDYWQMIWELAISCPIPYVEDGPFNWKQIDEVSISLQDHLQKRKQLLEDYQFEVVIDGLSLRKPNYYPYPTIRRHTQKPMTGKLFSIEFNENVYSRPLKLSGYLYLQDGQAIEPLDLSGVLVRIRNVAIGGYDPTFFKYPKIQGFRFNWLSSEIYVEEGLEHALNIDRDSFNEMHPHFVKLQQIVHTLLNQAFLEAGRNQKKRSQTKYEEQGYVKQKKLEQFIGEKLNNYELITTDQIKSPLVVDSKQRKILVNDQSPLLPKSASKQDLVRQIMLAFEMSMLVPEEQRRDKFFQLLLELINLELL